MNSMFMLVFRVNGGRIDIYSESNKSIDKSLSENLGISVNKAQWFKLKIVLYPGDADTFRAVIWFDADLTDSEGEKIVAVTDNYYDPTGKKLQNATSTPSKTFSGTSVYIMSSVNAEVLLDNLDSYVQKGKYVKPTDENLSFNVDAAE